MKKNKLKIFIFILTISICQTQNLFPILGGQRVGTSVFSFLNIGVSARAIGMGESVVALNHGASNISYNPGVIAQLEKTEVSLSTINWPSNIKYDYLSFSKKLIGRHSIGFNFGILHMDPMEKPQNFTQMEREIILYFKIGLSVLLMVLK